MLREFSLSPGVRCTKNMGIADGLDVMTLNQGQQLRIGDVVLEVTAGMQSLCVQMERLRPGTEEGAGRKARHVRKSCHDRDDLCRRRRKRLTCLTESPSNFPTIATRPAKSCLSYVRAADDLGYDAIFVPESWSREAFTTLGWIAANTTRVRVGTGSVNVFSRTPALIAQSIATLDEISGGRAVLGLGTSGPAVIENWHGMKFEGGLRRSLETVEVVRLALSGASVDYDGEIFKLRTSSGFPPVPRSRSNLPGVDGSKEQRARRPHR